MKNKLDPFAESLDAWKAEGKTLAEIQKQLTADGCKASLSSISEYLSARARERDQEEFFRLVASGGEMNRQLDAAYEKNPEPGIERLIRATQTLILSLQVKGAVDPKCLSLANSMQQTVMEFISGRFKADIKLKELALKEAKFRRDTAELFVKWSEDKRAREIAGGSASNSEKIEQLGKLMFGEDF